jgi:hypothetical protein
MFVAFAAAAVCCMVGLPFFARWAYHQSRKDLILRDYPRTYYVLGAVAGQALFAIVLLAAIDWAAMVDFHRGQPPFSGPIATILMLLGVGLAVIGIVCLIPMAVIVVRVHNAQRKR